MSSFRHDRPLRQVASLCLLVFASWVAPAFGRTADESQEDLPTTLKDLSLVELMDIEVTSVSRKPQTHHETSAAVTVIRGETIRRSGATSIPEALRLAPGVHVAQIDANKWAVGIRGFSSRLSRSVLAMSDGRSLYTPLFAGVYWESQDTLLDDIDRIEVVRGPGGSLWGSNAYSGVINIISKTARETQGWLINGGGGNQERGFGAFRYGGSKGEGFHYRVYGKYFDRDENFHEDGDGFDAWHMGQGGFRADWERGADNVSLFGNVYSGRSGQRTRIALFDPPYTSLVNGDAAFQGQNVLGRWRRALSGGSELELQFWYDRTDRREPLFEEVRNTVDFELRHRSSPFDNHDLNWGLGYRVSSDRTRGVPTVSFDPLGRTLPLYNGFVQDDIRITERLRLSLGAKLEHNAFSGFEFQPSVRFAWTEPGYTLWGAVSRAVRTPSRLDHDLSLTATRDEASGVFPRVLGQSSFAAENLVAVELGFRSRLGERILLDTAVFKNYYDDTGSIDPGTPFEEAAGSGTRTIFPYVIGNTLEGESHGFELSSHVSVHDGWRLRATYSFVDLTLRNKPGSLDPVSAQAAGRTPRHLAGLNSFVQLPGGFEVDLGLRGASALASDPVPGYLTADARLAFAPTPSLSLSLVGRNLLDAEHVEFVDAGRAIAVKRSIYFRVDLRF